MESRSRRQRREPEESSSRRRQEQVGVPRDSIKIFPSCISFHTNTAGPGASPAGLDKQVWIKNGRLPVASAKNTQMNFLLSSVFFVWRQTIMMFSLKTTNMLIFEFSCVPSPSKSSETVEFLDPR